MCGYVNYNDPRLQPPEDDEMTPTECYERCAHAKACKRIFERETGELYDAALELACDLCDEWEDME